MASFSLLSPASSCFAQDRSANDFGDSIGLLEPGDESLVDFLRGACGNITNELLLDDGARRERNHRFSERSLRVVFYSFQHLSGD